MPDITTNRAITYTKQVYTALVQNHSLSILSFVLNYKFQQSVRYKRVLMGVPNSQLTTIFSAKYQLTIIFLANSQLTTNFGSY